MSILLIFENKNVEPWEKALKEKLPNTTIEVYPNIKDKDVVDFVICWKPIKNVFEQFPNIKVIQSVGAAVDHITSTQTINKRRMKFIMSILRMYVINKHTNSEIYFLLFINVFNCAV